MSKYHFFERNFTFNNKKTRKFYYWYKDENGKRKQKSIEKESGIPDIGIRAAKAFVDQLNAAAVEEEHRLQSPTLGDYTEGFFVPGECKWLRRREQKDKITYKPHTIHIHQHNLTEYILQQYGDTPVDEIDGVEIEDWLQTLDMKNSTRNGIIHTFRIVLKEAKRDKIIKEVPEIESFSRRGSRRRDTLTLEETELLFPEDPKKLSEIWRNHDYQDEPDDAGLMFGVMFCFMLSAGLRSGEARALQREQLFPKYNGIVIDRAFDSSGNVTFPKKGSANDPRYRDIILPSKAWRILNLWLDKAKPNDFIFTFHDKSMSKDYLNDRFQVGLENAAKMPYIKFERRNRWITVHSLRYTWVSRMQALIAAGPLKEWSGHRSDSMTDHYSRPYLIERLKTHQDKRAAVEKFWKAS